MQKWEFILREQYEQDRIRLLDYREVDLEFKEWIINLMYKEMVKEDEPGEYDIDDDSVCDDRICDRECLRTEQDQDVVPGLDIQDDQWAQISIRIDRETTEEQPAVIIEEPSDEYDPYEEYYDEIVEYKSQAKAHPKKKHYKKK